LSSAGTRNQQPTTRCQQVSFWLNICMSWFKHKPKALEHRLLVPRRTGPIARDLWNQVKEKSKKPEEQAPTTKK
jgi:hypothetical protein|tara:strand:+ start:138 stop:359 length:222 start_codon:yes stop_codon:yes gene_type:complete